MSSFIGHALTAGAVFATRKNIKQDWSLSNLIWLCWLICIALAPDLDYVLPFLSTPQNNGLRISHSVAYITVLPIVTVFVLRIWGISGRELVIRTLQAFSAGFSHLVLDYLVGVHPLPLLWPVFNEPFRFEYGLLPSAGTPRLDNYYFYRNLAIELGILLPLFACIQFVVHRWLNSKTAYFVFAGLVLVSAGCMAISIGLSR